MTEEKTQLVEILDSIINNSLPNDSEDYEKLALQTILSSSIQAANFVAIIEEEFNIEFDDDDINIDFFTSLDRIIELIKVQKQN